MEFSTLDVTLDGNVATIALNRPDKANAMSEPMWYEIEQAMQWLDETPEARVGVLVGRGKYFTSGIDLALLMGVPAKIEAALPALAIVALGLLPLALLWRAMRLR